MKRWLVAAVLGAVAMGCQTGTSTSMTTADEGLSVQEAAAINDCYGEGNFCDAVMPPSREWKLGEPLPQTTETTVIVTMRESPSVWRAYAADPKARRILWQRSFKSSAAGGFSNAVAGSGRIAYGVRGPPPPECPPICINPGFVLGIALRVAAVETQAAEDVEACKL